MKILNGLTLLTLIFSGLLGVVPGVSVAGSVEGLETPLPGKVSSANKRKLKPMIAAIAKNQGVDKDLVHAVIAAESGYNPEAVSRAGAIGLMQVMPATAEDYGIQSSDALFDPETNIKVGTRHLKRLISKYRHVGRAVAAYNAGEGALESHRAFTYPETRRYSVQVINNYRRAKGKKPLSVGAKRSLRHKRIKIPSAVGKLDPKQHAPSSGSKSMFVLEWER